MRFQITNGDETKEYRSFLEAGKDLGVQTKIIQSIVLNNIGGGKFQGRKDNKILFIEKIEKNQDANPIAKIDGKEYFTAPEILREFNLRQKNFASQVKKNNFGFLDGNNNPHRIDWIDPEIVAKLQANYK